MKVIDTTFDKLDTTGNKPYTLKDKCHVILTLQDWYEPNGNRFICELELLPGFKTDGASIPKVFQWFLPSWDKENEMYNLAPTIHDALYANKGFLIFDREQCDDILRGIWRDSGTGGFKAGLADKCVEWFAGGSNHWGNDSYNVKDLVKLRLFKRMD